MTAALTGCCRSLIVALLGVVVLTIHCNRRDALRHTLLSSFLQHNAKRALYEEGEGGDGGGEEISDEVVSATILVVFLLLVVLTISFDIAKEHIEERAGRHLRPIIEALFGELTVLGFLSACTFVLSEAGVFHALGRGLFGLEAEELLEIFELVHFALFFVMLVFVIQVLEDVREGSKTAEEWMELDRSCRDKEYVAQLLNQRAEKEERRRRRKSKWGLRGLWAHISPYILFLPQLRRATVRSESLDDKLLFISLRKEFELERSTEPPFLPADPSMRTVSEGFNFGRYLSLCLGRKMAHVVEVDTATWTVLALFGTSIFLIFVAVERNMLIMSWLWVWTGYIVFFYNIYIEHYLVDVRRALTTPLRMRSQPETEVGQRVPLSSERMVDENKIPIFSLSDSDSSLFGEDGALPGWCSIDLEEHARQRPWLAKLVSEKGYQPNRQECLYWFQRKGPEFHSFILRVNLVFNGMYCALLFMIFFPAIWKLYGDNGAIHLFVLYVIMSAVPILAILFNKKHLILLMVQVGCVGTFRLPQLITRSRREERTAAAVRRLVIFHKLHLAAESLDNAGTMIGNLGSRRSSNKTLKNEVSDMFDLLDSNGDGAVSGEDFRVLMGRVGTSMNDDQVSKLLFTICSGTEKKDYVSKEAFLKWYSSQMGKDDEGMIRECARFLFCVVDTDRSGSISVSELKHALDHLKVGFSVDDAGDMLSELDMNETGIVAETEMWHFLEVYYPKELVMHSDTWRESCTRTLDSCTDQCVGEFA